MHATRHIKHGFTLSALMMLALLLPFVNGCESESRTDVSAGSGGLTFQVKWPASENNETLFNPAAITSCTDLGITTVGAEVYDENDVLLGRGGPWNCEDRQGTIQSITAGSEREVVLLCYDSDGDLIYRGEKEGITILPDIDNDGGEVDVTSFVAEKVTPADNSNVERDTVSLAWGVVDGASQYRVVISTQTDLSDPLINQTVTSSPYIPTGLDGETVYFWQVAAIDEAGNEGSNETAWQFTTDADDPGVNVDPLVDIVTPLPDEVFVSGDPVDFSATATDQEDGNLTGASVVWVSDFDGQVGIGTTFSISTLTEGVHIITVTATDSNNATATDTVRINVILSALDNPPVPNITSPVDGAVFNPGNTITFLGSGTDLEDGDLPDDSLEWKDENGNSLGFGATLDVVLPVGTHKISLTASDTNGSEVVLEITITVQALPEVFILEPDDGSSFLFSEDQSFLGDADDPEDGHLTGESLIWSSNVDGVFGTGTTVLLQGADRLSQGNHTITLTAIDSNGAVGTQSIDVYVEGEIVVDITPSSVDYDPVTSRINTFAAIDFIGSANDPEEGALPTNSFEWYLDTVWQSTESGLGTYSPLNGLPYGSHDIMLQVTDSDSNVGQTTITVIANNLPAGNIASPDDLGGYSLSTPTPPALEFFNLTDEGAIPASDIVWTSDLDGFLGTGTLVTNPVFTTAGWHVVTVTITDELGGVATYSVTINMS